MGCHVLPSVGGIIGGVRYSVFGLRHSHSCCVFGRRAIGDDNHGRYQPYGVGMLSEIHRKWPFGTLADNGDTSSKAP